MPPRSQNLSFTAEFIEEICLEIFAATCTKKIDKKSGKEVKTYKKVKNAKVEIISVSLVKSEKGQQLLFDYQSAEGIRKTVSTFNFMSDFTLAWDVTPEWSDLNKYQRIHKPLNSNFSPIESYALHDLFGEWLQSDAFVQNITVLSDQGVYAPDLIKLLFLFIAYQQGRYSKAVELGGYSLTMEIDLDRVVVIFKEYIKEYISGLSEDFVHLKKHYNVSQFTLSAAATREIESIQVTPSTPDV
jgi:hypothetical protein